MLCAQRKRHERGILNPATPHHHEVVDAHVDPEGHHGDDVDDPLMLTCARLHVGFSTWRRKRVPRGSKHRFTGRLGGLVDQTRVYMQSAPSLLKGESRSPMFLQKGEGAAIKELEMVIQYIR